MMTFLRSRSLTLVFSVLACLALSLGGCGWKLETQSSDAQAGEARRPAPAFSLANDDGSFVSLDELLADGKPAVLVFYRGHW